ncbi:MULTISPECIES: glycerophosphoryl diester phosphodiesterase membrane domain-containing protein [Streptomyces]|uniref:glycerophosphoryl diester phosphodiesterase membrane domain-containing protein n=1 Tax=Streptomyces TaxID=1883 RepID=UPI0003AAF7DF|nr:MULTISPECIES: glycerophosphoryl diester phosphodiesterase membrane domain-containing protein [Streptomyces]MBZ6113035.1 glycerophosphoryl diester phosphodiesterase membrane domain-containing protein [Streptomyces olivaceus]MBZ6126808.1 glycerophosphoryl diester phosphodiesterase membrane domain-containing protein [Streptomyces olivaceus]MBZ6147503.1 glycerophosphoryl diester phosphodiesterase membrane domain-containing protein [Streptomyces olivaceus]MBZ6161252.1 glycerophosphoryl diester ph
MNDTPGWASPGSAPSDGREPGASGPAEPADRPAGPDQPAQPADRPGAEPTSPGTKWSKEQPPPGQWSAPTGPTAPGQAPPPPPPGQGWGAPPPAPPGGGHRGPGGGWGGYGAPGGHGGWGGGWGGPPPAAKPGVIPLRPLGVGEILDGAVSTMRSYWRTVLGVSLTVAVFTEIIVVLLQGLVLDNTSTEALNDPDATLSELGDALTDTTVNSGVVFLLSLIGTVLATALLTTVTSRAVLGRPVTTAEAWRDAQPQVLKLFGLIILLLLIVAGIVTVAMAPGLLVAAAGAGGPGLALTVLGFLGGGVVTVWLMVRLSLASPALMLEKQSIRKAMGRSAKLVRGSWWRVFGIQLLATVIANVVASIIVIPFTFLAATLGGDGVGGLLEGSGDLGWTFLVVSGIGSVIGSMITFPITAGVTVLLYIDQRIRREALDLDLARAAGSRGPGAPGAVPGS